MSNNTDLQKMLALFEGKEAKKEDGKETVKEFEMKPTPASKKGMFKGKTKEELKKMRTKVKAQMKSHEDKGEKVPKELRSKLSEINFALRAKHNWGTAESVVTDKDAITENTDFKQLKKYLAENFWGGEEETTEEPEEDSEEGSGFGGSGEEGEEDSDSFNGSGEGEESEDVLKMDMPVFIKFLEYARENAKSDDDLHELAEKLSQCSEGGEKTLTMADYEECCGNCEDEGSGMTGSGFGDEGEESEPAFGRDNGPEGSGEDGFSRSVAAESIRHMMNKIFK